MTFMTWSLNRPSTSDFDRYYRLKEGEAWYSDQYELVDPDAFKEHNSRGVKGFVDALEAYPEKFDALGMHEFGISDNGDIFNMGYGQIPYPNGYYYNDPNMRVLNDAEDDIERPVPTSLMYYMHKYPQIRWALQFLATANSSGDRVTSLLNNTEKPLFTAVETTEGTIFEPDRDESGNIIYVNAQDEFIRQAKRITEIYLEKGFPITDVEIDMEKTTTLEGEDQLFADLLARVKRDICIPLGLGLRVNLFAMTGEYRPDYYGWHNYSTVAKAEVNGVQAVDEFQLMTYDFSWGGSAPGASTPLWWLQQVLDHIRDLENRGLWKARDVYIGNAGYGRRWSLNEDRMGVTFDFKQMLMMQNGEYVHNDGGAVYPHEDDPEYSEFHFRDQDFIPFAGYNDAESDYQINYPHVYDRFSITANGGAVFNGINMPDSGEYVTNYSLKQRPIFNGVIDYKTTPDSMYGRYEQVAPATMDEVQGDLPVESWDRYIMQSAYVHPDTGEPTGKEGDAEGRIEYNLNATGTYRVVMQVTFPFYDKSSTTVFINGDPVALAVGDWYSFNLMQRNHFIDLGEFTSESPLTVVVGDSSGVIVGGVVACESFEHNMTGGTTDLVTSTYPYMRRGEVQDNGDVEIIPAQFPDSMDLVGEVLRRPPRPALIWEDVFSSHVSDQGEGFNLLDHLYYYPTSEGGYSIGNWDAHVDGDYGHARTDSRGTVSTFALNRMFGTNIMAQAEVWADSADTGAYGFNIITGGSESGVLGYSILLDYSDYTIKLIRKETERGVGDVELSEPMSQSLRYMNGSRLTLTLYVMDGSISFRVSDRFYISDYSPVNSFNEVAYGFSVENSRARLYRYSLSSLDKYERMERIEVFVGGELANIYGDVERDVVYDEHGFLTYSGFPADILDAVNRPTNDTVLDTEVEPHDWSTDYQNKVLTSVAGWAVGKHNVTIRFKDVGIWFRRFYVGDSEGMSISYNSDKVALIRTAELIRDYDCKGIAMWTLGQEDPTIFTYLPDVW